MMSPLRLETLRLESYKFYSWAICYEEIHVKLL